ncbi:MAG: homogentisate phytyltransferase [Drouetiella hepatica Uher 2000/2452]|jgi:homogentisate phytyltransferase/homogentisate geranylgeranyltransferase|uniref:Homogentisate phytyltransferase n=1 Tax=Drouetiella hepatica Uher 2000/2452 TaxID=904376 RepID=A0A951QG93_9CYAN|nr:homogentisate phytyltransferase [Drouetiella hepatica Uher 2000/2452]
MSQISSESSSASASSSGQSSGQSRGQSHPPRSPLSWLSAFWKFCRPHTIIGTSLSVLGIGVIAWARTNQEVPYEFLLLMVPALIACLCGNVYIVGLNQIEDVEIDRINKPHLPIASGEFSRRLGWAIVLTSGILALVLSAGSGLFLMATVWISLLIGTAYSLPPIRLKRFPVWASLCIFSVRGAIVNLGLFLHFNQKLGEPPQIPATVWALTLFVLVFTFAIAIFKDIPDLEGDRLYHITTFTVKLGQRSVFNLARWVLTVCYGGMVAAGLVISGVNSAFVVGWHLVALILLWATSLKVNLQDQKAIAQFYQFIWKLFYLEYILFPLACYLA